MGQQVNMRGARRLLFLEVRDYGLSDLCGAGRDCGG